MQSCDYTGQWCGLFDNRCGTVRNTHARARVATAGAALITGCDAKQQCHARFIANTGTLLYIVTL